MTLKIEKKGICEICDTKGYTELMHIFGRNKIIVNDERNIIEGCKVCHSRENHPAIMEVILYIQRKKYDNWDEWALETARQKSKFKWIERLTR